MKSKSLYSLLCIGISIANAARLVVFNDIHLDTNMSLGCALPCFELGEYG